MERIFITNQIKFDILRTGGLPADHPYNLTANTPLIKIGYDTDLHCRLLEERLHEIAQEYNTGKKVAEGDVSKYLTVRECIQLVVAS
ncbi:MAG: hypothetical protein JKY70_01560 [Mucilaginibacter sp.]|nr:hypothetical protein [Mucilaginibacter sp.]